MKVSYKNITYASILLSIIGFNFISFDIGIFQLSPYRILIIFAPLFIEKTLSAAFKKIKNKIDFDYIFFMLTWVLYSFISVIWVIDYISWLRTLVFLITGFLSSLFVFTYLNDNKDLIKALSLIVFLSFALSILAIYEIMTGNYFFVAAKNIDYYLEKSLLVSAIGFREPVTLFGNPNDYSLFLFFSVASAFLLIRVTQNKFYKLFYLLAIIIFIFLILCTRSRSVFFAILIFFLLSWIIFFLNSNIKWKIKLFSITLLVGILITPILINNFDLFQDVSEIDFSDGNAEGSDAIRLNLMRNGFIFLYNTYFLGVGLGNIEYYMLKFPIYSTGATLNIHNWWLEILISSGVLIFVFYMVIYFKSLKNLLLRIFRGTNSFDKSISSTFFCYFLSFLVASIGASSLMGSEWIWPLMAISMKFASNYKLD